MLGSALLPLSVSIAIGIAMPLTPAFGVDSAAAADESSADQPANAKGEQALEQVRARAVMRRASNIIGSAVTNYQGEALGDVKDLVMDLHSGAVAYVVIATGGVIGLGERWHAVPMASLQLNRAHDAFLMNMNHEAWVHAPGFDKDHWPNLGSDAWHQETDRYYERRRK
jgi:sporulation protein YlmC with PRC-barrel domain